MANPNPLVSIIIPTYNRAHLIGETLQSVKNQTYQNWECIVVDDGSTDETHEVIEKLALADSRFIYWQNTRTKGAPGARNTGLYSSKGEYIFFLDSDDLLLPPYIENRISYFNSNPEIDMVVGLQKLLQDGEASFYLNFPSSFHPLLRFYSLFPYNDIPWINNLLIKKSFVIENHIEWDESVILHQDIQFNVHLLVRNPVIKWAHTDFDGYWINNTNGGSMGNQTYNEAEVYKKLIEIYWTNMENCELGREFKKLLKKQYHAFLIFVSLRLAKNREVIFRDYLSFVKGQSSFGPADFILLQKFEQLAKIKSRKYIHRLLSRIIKKYLTSVHLPVITEGTFLKMKEIPASFKIENNKDNIA